MSTVRFFKINGKACIGCEACTRVCPSGLISLNDTGSVRTLKLTASCSENCDLCEKACSENAIALSQDAGDVSEEFIELSFSMIECKDCSKAYTTTKMADKVSKSLFEKIKGVELSWVDLCHDCKQEKTALQVIGKKAQLE